MWSIFNGTVVNIATVAVGSLAGIAIGGRLPGRFQSIVLTALGLVTVTLGIDAAVLTLVGTVESVGPRVQGTETYGARLAMVMISCLLVGCILGTMLRIHERIEALGGWIHSRFSKQDGRQFAEGFLTASVIFCVGPLTLLGCLRNGAQGDPSYLYIKSVLDGFCSMALASTLGWGVLASVLTVAVFQGGLAWLAAIVSDPLDPVSMALMTMVGGIVLLATSLMILEIKKIPVADMIPGIFLPPLAVLVVEWIAPGTLLPSAV